MPRNSKCDECVLSELTPGKNLCVWGQGDGEAFIVGEAPGRHEADKGIPFQGQAGKILRSNLESIGLADAYITNAVKCRPPDNRKPESDELRACKHYLEEEIEDRDPKAVLLLGATSLKACTGKAKITEMNGQVVEKNGRKYVGCFHPAYVLRDPSKLSSFQMALRRYKDVLEGTDEQEEITYRVLTKYNFDEFLDELENCEVAAADTETTGLDWYNIDTFRVNIMTITMDGNNWVVPLDYQGALSYEHQRQLVELICEGLEGKVVITQNGKYDNLVLMSQYGCRLPITFDTMLAHYALDENSPHGLKVTSREFCNAPDYDLTTKEKQGNCDTGKFYLYGAMDSYYTYKLYFIFNEMLNEDEDSRFIFNRILMPCQELFERIEFNGLWVDIDKMDEVERQTIKEKADIENQLNKIVGRTVLWSSPSQVAEALFGDLGLKPTVYTPKGAPSTSETALVDIEHPIAKLLEEWRGKDKFLSTYINGWKNFMVGQHLYLGTKVHGTVTGRFSSRLHQVPRDGTIRNLITAPPGWTFVQLDFSQAELRVVAIMARDPELLRCYKEDIDVHWKTLYEAIQQGGGGEYYDYVMETAEKHTGKKIRDFQKALDIWFEIGPDKAVEYWKGWKEGRKKAKGINFGFVYGMGAFKFVEYAKTKYGFEPTMEEATDYREGFFRSYPSLESWHEKQRAHAKRMGFVRNLFGRKRRLPSIHSVEKSAKAEAERQAVNAPVQGFIGDYKAFVMLEIDQTFSWNVVRQVGEVHDSTLIWVRTNKLDKVLPRIRKIAESPKILEELGMEFPIKLAADIEVGTWGAGKVYKEDL